MCRYVGPLNHWLMASTGVAWNWIYCVILEQGIFLSLAIDLSTNAPLWTLFSHICVLTADHVSFRRILWHSYASLQVTNDARLMLSRLGLPDLLLNELKVPLAALDACWHCTGRIELVRADSLDTPSYSIKAAADQHLLINHLRVHQTVSLCAYLCQFYRLDNFRVTVKLFSSEIKYTRYNLPRLKY